MEQNTTEVAESETVETTEHSNNDVKSSPLFQKLASELAEIKRADAERLQLEQAAKKEAETKQLEAQGKYEEALKMREQEIENIKSQHQKEITQRDLKNELLTAGFTNQVFIKGAIAEYEEGDISEYARQLASDESNKPFLGAIKQVFTPPSGGNVNGVSSVTIKTADDYNRAKTSADPNIRKQARDYGADYFNKHGRMP